MKFFKALNIFAIILSFVCAAAAGCYVIWVGSKSNFQNGVAAILALFLFAGIGVFGILTENYLKDEQDNKEKDPSGKGKHPFFMLLSKGLLLVFLASFICSLVILVKSFGYFKSPVSVKNQNGTQSFPVDRIVESDSFLVVDYLGKADPENEETKKNAKEIIPDCYLIVLEPGAQSESPSMILAKAGKENAKALNESTGVLSEKKISSYLREMSQSETEKIDAYLKDHPEIAKAQILPYCMSDVHVEGVARYSVFRPVEIFAMCLLLSFVSLVLTLRIIKALRPSLVDFIAPRFV